MTYSVKSNNFKISSKVGNGSHCSFYDASEAGFLKLWQFQVLLQLFPNLILKYGVEMPVILLDNDFGNIPFAYDLRLLNLLVS